MKEPHKPEAPEPVPLWVWTRVHKIYLPHVGLIWNRTQMIRDVHFIKKKKNLITRRIKNQFN